MCKLSILTVTLLGISHYNPIFQMRKWRQKGINLLEVTKVASNGVRMQAQATQFPCLHSLPLHNFTP